MPGVNDESGLSAGKPATICVPEASKVGNRDAPSITEGLLPKLWPLMTIAARLALTEVP